MLILLLISISSLIFSVTKTIEVIETTSANHPEGIFDCHTRTEYGKIALEEYMCDSYDLTKTIEFNNYSLKEVQSL